MHLAVVPIQCSSKWKHVAGLWMMSWCKITGSAWSLCCDTKMSMLASRIKPEYFYLLRIDINNSTLTQEKHSPLYSLPRLNGSGRVGPTGIEVIVPRRAREPTCSRSYRNDILPTKDVEVMTENFDEYLEVMKSAKRTHQGSRGLLGNDRTTPAPSTWLPTQRLALDSKCRGTRARATSRTACR